jgi:hypothetical protein
MNATYSGAKANLVKSLPKVLQHLADFTLNGG